MGPGARPLRREDDRSTFRSGDPSLDAFFAQYAGQHQFKAHASVTYVVDREGRIAGYATVTAACIDIDDLPPEDRLRYPYPAPVLSLARLATDERDRGRELGASFSRMCSCSPRRWLTNSDAWAWSSIRKPARCPSTRSTVSSRGLW